MGCRRAQCRNGQVDLRTWNQNKNLKEAREFTKPRGRNIPGSGEESGISPKGSPRLACMASGLCHLQILEHHYWVHLSVSLCQPPAQEFVRAYS